MYFEVDGKKTFAATGGGDFDPARPAVVFLHGSGLDHRFWDGYVDSFAASGYTVLAPDLPGHTNSEGPPLDSIEDMAGWLDNVLTQVGAGRVSLVGHSQGCLVSLEYAARHPHGLRSLSLIASGLATPVNPALIEAAGKEPDAAVEMMLSWGFGGRDTPPEERERLAPLIRLGGEIMRGNAPEALRADLVACDTYRNGQAAARGIRCPAQVILGGQDRMAPREAGLGLARGLYGDGGEAELDIMEWSGHMVPLEAPDECRRRLHGFITANNTVQP